MDLPLKCELESKEYGLPKHGPQILSVGTRFVSRGMPPPQTGLAMPVDKNLVIETSHPGPPVKCNQPRHSSFCSANSFCWIRLCRTPHRSSISTVPNVRGRRITGRAAERELRLLCRQLLPQVPRTVVERRGLQTS
jgi:hypothetical protein